MIVANFRVTFRKHVAHEVRHAERVVLADDVCRAISQAGWMLDAEHPNDHGEYEFQMCVRVERSADVEGVPS